MKRKPIKADKVGCTCSVNYSILPKDIIFDGFGVHIHTLKIDSRYYALDFGITLEEVFKKYETEFKSAELAEIEIMTPLHNETYELCKEINEFLLVEQGQGYA